MSVRYQTPFSSRHESGPSWFLSTGKHPVGGQLPRVFFSALPGQSSDRPNLPPHKNCRFFSFLSPVFGEQPPKHAVDWGSEESIVQRPNGQVRSFRGPPSRPSFSTGPWSSCIVTGHDRLMTVTSRRTCAYCMPVDLLPALAVDLLPRYWCSKQPRAVCRKCFMFHLDRVDLRPCHGRRSTRSRAVVRAICQRSISV